LSDGESCEQSADATASRGSLASASLTIVLPDHTATQVLGHALAAAVTTRAIIALNGPMGAGKTTLVQGLAKALGVKETVSSPTFTMMNEYHSGRLPLYHLDLYRLSEDAEAISDMLAAELDQFIEQKMIAVIEWADLFTLKASDRSYFYQLDHLVVNLDYVEEVKPSEEGKKNSPSFYMENGRKANLTAFGAESSTLISRLKNAMESNLKIP
jgi:tRNA threonylcarbamoyladenosine biosynthesis protein TsaE